MKSKRINPGDKVRLLKKEACRYYNYPRGENRHMAKAGAIGTVVRAYVPKVWATQERCQYFATIEIDGVEYSVLHTGLEPVSGRA